MLCADIVETSWNDPSFQGKHEPVALLEDISRSGLGLLLEAQVSVGTQVHVECPGGRMTGTVRYCQYREHCYFVGIELENGTAWSCDRFKPKHLLDLQEFVIHPAGPGYYIN
jgi:hypothetical protein